ncbi:hypothetical protein EDB89DRAFT_1912472 [Lactarius sanguifluus]|nr:hypothetical protein EDB89DRAFT_1912472 [Lactarius sanguifluus]
MTTMVVGQFDNNGGSGGRTVQRQQQWQQGYSKGVAYGNNNESMGQAMATVASMLYILLLNFSHTNALPSLPVPRCPIVVAVDGGGGAPCWGHAVLAVPCWSCRVGRAVLGLRRVEVASQWSLVRGGPAWWSGGHVMTAGGGVGHGIGAGFRAAGYWWWWRLMETGPRGSCSGDGTRPKPRSLACRDGMASGRGFHAAGYWWWWRLTETGPQAAAVTWSVRRYGEKKKKKTYLSTRPKHGGGGYGLMWGEAAAVTWLCDSEKRLKQKKRKRKKLIWVCTGPVVTRVLVTIVVAVGIVGDAVMRCTKSPRLKIIRLPPININNEQSNPYFSSGATSCISPRHPQFPLQPQWSPTHHVTAAATSWPRLCQPSPPPVPRRAKAPSRRHAVATCKTPADDELGFGLVP